MGYFFLTPFISIYTYFFRPLVSNFAYNLPAYSPAYLDLLKLVTGSILWFGGLIGFMYWRQRKLTTVISK